MYTITVQPDNIPAQGIPAALTVGMNRPIYIFLPDHFEIQSSFK